MCHGKADAVVQYSWGQKSFEELQKHLTKTTFKAYDNMGHSASMEELQDIADFVENIVNKEAKL